MRVVSWNVWWKFDDVEQRQRLIVQNLLALNPDAVMLQETWPAQVESLAEQTGMHGYFLGDVAGEDQREFGIGMLLRDKPREIREFNLPAAPRDYEDSNRYFLAALLNGPNGPVWLGTTHLSHTSNAYKLAGTEPVDTEIGQECRLRQLAVLLPVLTELQQSAAVVFGGDLNFMPGSVEYQEFAKVDLADAWLDRPRLGDRSTILANNPYLAKEQSGVEALAAELPGNAAGANYCLDFQFFAGNISARRAWTVGAGNPAERSSWPSDHLAVVVDYVTSDK